MDFIQGVRGWATYQFLLFAVQIWESGSQFLQSTWSIRRSTTSTDKLDNGLVAPRQNRDVLIVDSDNWRGTGFVHRGRDEKDREQSSLVGLRGQSKLELRHLEVTLKTKIQQ